VDTLERDAQQWKVQDLTRTRFVIDEPIVRLKCPNDPTIFEVSKSILLREPGTFFATLLSGRWDDTRKDDTVVLPLEDASIGLFVMCTLSSSPCAHLPLAMFY